MKLHYLFFISSVLLAFGCKAALQPPPNAHQAKTEAAPAKAEPTVPKNWKAVVMHSGSQGFYFAVPKALKEASVDGIKYAAKDKDDLFFVGFDYEADIVTLKRHTEQVMKSLSEMDAEVVGIKQFEVDEHDAVVLAAVHDDSAFVVVAWVNNRVGYQLTCETSHLELAEKMAETCLAIVETFKFTK